MPRDELDQGIRMRLLAIDYLRPGMVTGLPIYPPTETRGIPLLTAGVEITENVLRRLREIDISSVFIDDNLSAGIDSSVLLEPAERLHALRAVEQVYVHLQSGKNSIDPGHIQELEHAVSEVIMDIMHDRHTLMCATDVQVHGTSLFQRAVNACIMACNVARTYFNDHGWLDFRGNLRQDHIPERIQKLGMGMLLSDIGLTTMPESLLSTPARKLSVDDRATLQQHPIIGLHLVANTELSPLTKIVIAQHHERYNGTGYPRQLTAHEIHINGHIASIVNNFLDLLDHNLSGSSITDPLEAWRQIIANVDENFHPEVVDAFRVSIAPLGNGTAVRLSDGRSGLVVSTPLDAPESPRVRITHRPNDDLALTPFEEIDLTRERDLEILGQLPVLPTDTMRQAIS